MKATAIAPSNVAFVKYMGRKDEVLRLPENASIAMNLSDLLTTTTVEFSSANPADVVEINGKPQEGESERVIKHLDRIRALAGTQDRAKVVSSNSFPTGTGLSSSSSGFAALTVAGAAAAGLQLTERELSILARQGSGSACRSIPDGFVEWKDGNASDDSFATTLFPPDHWDIADVVAVVSQARKPVATSAAHQHVAAGPYYVARLARMPAKVEQCKQLLAEKNFDAFGIMLEEEALDLHVIFLSAGIIYLTPESLRLIGLVREWRAGGLPVYFTVNTGQDVHILCEGVTVPALRDRLAELDFVREVIVNTPAQGTRLTDQHLF